MVGRQRAKSPPTGVMRRHLFPKAAHFLPLDPGSVLGSAGREGGTSAISKDERSPVLSEGACSLWGR